MKVKARDSGLRLSRHETAEGSVYAVTLHGAEGILEVLAEVRQSIDVVCIVRAVQSSDILESVECREGGEVRLVDFTK